jgi:hypothetical protein
MFEEIFDRNGDKVYGRNLRVFSQRKSAKRGFFKSSSHSSTASGSRTCLTLKYPNYARIGSGHEIYIRLLFLTGRTNEDF